MGLFSTTEVQCVLDSSSLESDEFDSQLLVLLAIHMPQVHCLVTCGPTTDLLELMERRLFFLGGNFPCDSATLFLETTFISWLGPTPPACRMEQSTQ